MQLILHPTRSDAVLDLARDGDRLVVNGAVLDFAPLPDGASLPRAAISCPWIAGDVRRDGGILQIPIILPIGRDAPPAARFPAPLTVTGDGPVTLPGTVARPTATHTVLPPDSREEANDETRNAH